MMCYSSPKLLLNKLASSETQFKILARRHVRKINEVKSKAFCSPSVPLGIKSSIQYLSQINFTNRLGRYLGVPLLQAELGVMTSDLLLTSWRHVSIVGKGSFQQSRKSHSREVCSSLFAYLQHADPLAPREDLQCDRYACENLRLG